MDWALPTLEDVGHFFQQHVLKQQVSESAILDDVMSRQIICVTTGVSLSSLVNTLKKVSGVCVVDDERRLIGIVSRADVRDKQGVRNLSSSYTIGTAPLRPLVLARNRCCCTRFSGRSRTVPFLPLFFSIAAPNGDALCLLWCSLTDVCLAIITPWPCPP